MEQRPGRRANQPSQDFETGYVWARRAGIDAGKNASTVSHTLRKNPVKCQVTNGIGDDLARETETFQARHIRRNVHQRNLQHSNRANNLAMPPGQIHRVQDTPKKGAGHNCRAPDRIRSVSGSAENPFGSGKAVMVSSLMWHIPFSAEN